MADVFKHALATAREELKNLILQQKRIEERIADLKQTVSGLAALVEPKTTGPVKIESITKIETGPKPKPIVADANTVGLTETCRTVLKMAGHPLTAPEIKAEAEGLGYVWRTPSNAVAAVHTILNRLMEQGQAIRETESGKDGKETVRYRWRTDDYDRMIEAMPTPEPEPAIEPLTDDDIPF